MKLFKVMQFVLFFIIKFVKSCVTNIARMEWLKTYQITKRLLVTFVNAWPEVGELPLGIVTVDACTATDNGASDAWLSCRPFFTLLLR